VRILITGAAGFVGSRLVQHLADRHELFAIARRPPAVLADRAHWIEQDLRAFDADALPDRIDGVVHLAQSPRWRDFPDGAADVYAVNVASTFALLEYARQAGAQGFVLASTGGVYAPSAQPITEADEPRPTAFYFRSKRAAEELAAAYAELLSVVVLRPFFVYGPGQDRMLIAGLIDKVTGGGPIVVDGDPGLTINPIHVADAVRVFEPALTLGRSTTVNVAGPENVTITDLVRQIGELTGRAPDISHRGEQPAGDLVADISRLRDELGVNPAIGLSEGLRDAIALAAQSER
jgi:nucleoside-diphosphate-sugar epimerase